MVVMESKTTDSVRPATKHKRRFCKIEGCERIVKSQGLCQRHGAKPCKCKIDGCGKQAQGNFNGMCKAHFRQIPSDEMQVSSPLSPSGKSTICIPVAVESPSHCVEVNAPRFDLQVPQKEIENIQFVSKKTQITKSRRTDTADYLRVLSYRQNTAYDQAIPASISWDPQSGSLMPLIACLQSGFDTGKQPGWHRYEERAARSLASVPVRSPLEAWEMELLFIEILILTGNPQSCFRYLAHAWGQPEGFHLAFGRRVCGKEEVNEVSETESETGGSQVSSAYTASSVPSNTTCSGSSYDLSEEECSSKPNSRSPLDTLIALLSSNE